MSLETENRSIYSLMSRRKSEFCGSLNRNSASDFASSVLPTPCKMMVSIQYQQNCSFITISAG